MHVILHPIHGPPVFEDVHALRSRVPLMTRMLIVIMNLLGFSDSLIVEWSGHPLSTIHRWVNRFSAAGDVLDAPGRGRRRVTTQEIDAAIVSLAEEEKFITPRVIRNRLGVRASVRTIRRRLNEAGLFGRVARISWPLSQDVIQERLTFAEDYAGWDGNDWGSVLFSDEACIWLGDASQIWVQRPEDTAFLDQYMVHRPDSHAKISVWAGFSALGLTRIHIVEGTMNSAKLVDIFSSELHQYARRTWRNQQWHLLQDNSPVHTSDEVQDWLADNEIPRFDFPRYSPDLNPMENLWAYLKRELDHDFYENTEQLAVAVQNQWNKIPLEILLALVESMPHRLEAVRVHRGFKTKY
jgi:transposase